MTDVAKGVELLDRRPPNVVFCPHPLMPARDRQLIFEPPRGAEYLDAYLSRVIGHLPDPCVVTIGDRAVPREWWGRVRVKKGDLIGVAATVQGGGGSDVGRTLLMVAVVVAAVYSGGAAAGAAGWSGAGAMTLGQTAAYVAASAAVMAVGMMAVNALMPLPQADLTKLAGDSGSTNYSLSGGSNRARRYEPLPLVIGTHRMFPDAACASYTLYLNGNDQYLYAAYNFGFGDLEITDLRIGDTPLTDYQGVTVAWGDGFMPSLVASNVDTQGGTSLTVAGGAIARTTSVDTFEIHIDLQYVMFHAGSGGLESLGATIKFEYRPVGTPTWLPFNGADGTVTWFGTTDAAPQLPFTSTDGTAWLESSARTPWRTTLRKVVTKGQYDLRITKVTADVTSAQDTCEIGVSAIRSLQPDEGNYSGQRILALKIRASSQLNGVVNQLSGLVSHRLGGVATSNPAKWFKAFALGAFSASGRRRWGAGLALSKIDVAALDAWATWCEAKGLTCNMVIDTAASCATILDRIARCGRGSKTWAPGVLSAVWDAADQPVSAMFSPVNIRAGTFSVSYPSEDLADELEVSYINPDNNWQRDTVRVPPGATDVQRTASVELLGCTNTELAGKEANLLYAQNLYRYRSISWETDIEGLTVCKGAVVSLSHDLTRWGQAGRLVAVTSTTALTLDQPITLKPAGCWISIFRPAGVISYHRVQVGTTETESATVTLLDPLPVTPDADGSLPVDWRYTADAKAVPGWRVKVVEVSPISGMEGMRIVAQDDPDEYYAAESGSFSHVATPVTSKVPALSGLQVSEELIQAGSGYAVQLHLSWSAQGDVAATRVRWGMSDGPMQDAGFAAGTRHVLLVPEVGTVLVEVTGFNGLGQSGTGSRLSGTHVIVGQDVPPPGVTGFAVSVLADGTRAFSWTLATVPPDVTYLEIRYAASSGTTWGAMTPIGRVPFGSGRAESSLPAAGTWTFEARMLDASANYSSAGARVTVTLGEAPSAPVAGVNRLYNSSRLVTAGNDDGWYPWTNRVGFFGGSSGDVAGYGYNSAAWSLKDASSRYTTMGEPVDGEVVDWSSALQQLAVLPGMRLEAHALLGSHRCTGYVIVLFTNALDQYHSEFVLGTVTAAENKPGGKLLSDWKKVGGFIVVPTTSAGTTPSVPARATLVLRQGQTDPGYMNSYLFHDQAFLGEATAGQQTLSPWSDGARTVTNTSQLTDGAGFGAAAASAQAAADAANAKHVEIASDYKLSPLEKQAGQKEWAEIVSSYGGIDGQAAGFSITTERTAHTDWYNLLSGYLSPLFADATTTSDIDGPTYRWYWSNYYAARQALLNKIAAVASTLAQWQGVGGAGKPIDSAGKIIDLGDGTGAGQRQANDAPGWYPVGTTQQFKWASSVGVGLSEWGVLRTERSWGDDSAAVVQTWKSSSGEWKRTGTIAAGWVSWTRRIDRPITSGNASDFVSPGAVNTTELNGTAASERVVLFDAAGVSHSNIA
jgi:sulfur carrier protein ThiS